MSEVFLEMPAKDFRKGLGLKESSPTVAKHTHAWVPIKLWWNMERHTGPGSYSMELACTCGTFKIIDAQPLEGV